MLPVTDESSLAVTELIKNRRQSLEGDIEQLTSIFRKIKEEKDDLYSVNDGKFFDMGMIPDVAQSTNYPFPTNGYDPAGEPKFNAKVHLALEKPDYVATMDNGKYTAVKSYTAKPSKKGSDFMFSSPFKLFTEEGTKVARAILTKLKRGAKSNGRSTCARGIFHSSPWFRDLLLSTEYTNHMSSICGEPVYSHMYLQNLQMNVGKVGGGVVDQWHFDSVSYVCVALLSDIDDMKGGELELVKDTKENAINLVLEGAYTDNDLVRVGYRKSGDAILAHGAKIIHHVTPVEYAKEDRLSLIISCTPANAFQPDLTIFNSMQSLDSNYTPGLPEFQFFRQKMWQMSAVLREYTMNEPFVEKDSGSYYAKKARVVADELNRVASLLDKSSEDKIGFFAEKGQGSSWLK